MATGYRDAAEYWIVDYEDAEFETLIAGLWDEVRPLYEQLHAYVLLRLRAKYSDHVDDFPDTGQIPAHILGTENFHARLFRARGVNRCTTQCSGHLVSQAPRGLFIAKSWWLHDVQQSETGRKNARWESSETRCFWRIGARGALLRNAAFQTPRLSSRGDLMSRPNF